MTNIASSLEQDIPEKYQSLQCLRIEENKNRIIFLYYQQYPKKNSERFPQNLTAIFFYFDYQLEDEFFYLYASLVGQVDDVKQGSFFNRKGSKSKRRVVNFAIVKFVEEESMTKLKDTKLVQRAINNYLDNKRNRNIQLSYDPLKDNIDEENEEKEVDDDGFVEVKPNTAKHNFSKGGLSFKVMKETEEDEDILNAGKRKKNKDKGNDFYWNFQVLDKKRQMYDELKMLFDEDKRAINNKKRKTE